MGLGYVRKSELAWGISGFWPLCGFHLRPLAVTLGAAYGWPRWFPEAAVPRGSKGNTVRITHQGPTPWLPPQL